MAANSIPWWSKNTVAVVTGGNKGIGYGIVGLLAEQGVTVVLTARDQSRGQAAADNLKAHGVLFHQLDVTSSESVSALATWLKSKFGGIDILVNNAAANLPAPGQGVSYEFAKQIVGTNYFGLKNVTEGLLPLLRSSPVKNVTEGLLPLLRSSPAGARIVNVSSRRGLYERLRSEALLKTFRDEDGYTEELIDSLARKYLEDVRAGRWDAEGWIDGPGPMYSESKIFVNAYAPTLAKTLSKSQPADHQIFVTSFCPGVVLTDMALTAIGGHDKLPQGITFKSPAEGADTGLWLALLPKEELEQKNGKFFADREEITKGGHFQAPK